MSYHMSMLTVDLVKVDFGPGQGLTVYLVNVGCGPGQG